MFKTVRDTVDFTDKESVLQWLKCNCTKDTCDVDITTRVEYSDLEDDECLDIVLFGEKPYTCMPCRSFLMMVEAQLDLDQHIRDPHGKNFDADSLRVIEVYAKKYEISLTKKNIGIPNKKLVILNSGLNQFMTSIFIVDKQILINEHATDFQLIEHKNNVSEFLGYIPGILDSNITGSDDITSSTMILLLYKIWESGKFDIDMMKKILNKSEMYWSNDFSVVHCLIGDENIVDIIDCRKELLGEIIGYEVDFVNFLCQRNLSGNIGYDYFVENKEIFAAYLMDSCTPRTKAVKFSRMFTELTSILDDTYDSLKFPDYLKPDTFIPKNPLEFGLCGSPFDILNNILFMR